MKHNILSVCLLCLFGSVNAQVQHTHSSCTEDSLDHIAEAILSEITVTGVTGTQRLKDSPIPFSVISPKDLHQTPGSDIIEKISHEPGVSMVSTGEGISKPVIRGLGFNRVVVIEQGVRQEDGQWGEEHGIEVSDEGVHSVEILKGPASLMYGSDAIAGVLILHPEKPLPLNTIGIKAGGEYHSNNGLYSYNANFSGNKNGFLWNFLYDDKKAHCFKNSADGYVPGSWFGERDFCGMLGISKNWGHSWLRFSRVNFTPGITEGERDEENGELLWEDGNSAKSYRRQLPSQEVFHTKAVSDNAWYIGRGKLKFILGFQQNKREEFEECPDEAELSMRLNTLTYDARYEYSLCRKWNLATGFNGMSQKNKNEAEEMLIPDYHSFDFGYFVTASKDLERFHISGGARFDNRKLTAESHTEDNKIKFSALSKNFSGFTGSLGTVFNLSDRANTRLNISRGFRAPTVSELSSNGVHEGSIQYELGNENLKPEFSTQIDLGFDLTAKKFLLSSSIFSNWINNYIFMQRLPFLTDDYQTFVYTQQSARLFGGEIFVDFHPVNSLHLSNSFSYIRGTFESEENEKFNLPLIPAPKWNLDLKYNFRNFAKGHCQRSFVSMNMEYNLEQKHFYSLHDTESRTPQSVIFNIQTGMDLHIFSAGCIEVSFAVHNLFDKVYQSHLSRLKYADCPGIHAEGRSYIFKLNIPFSIKLREDVREG